MAIPSMGRKNSVKNPDLPCVFSFYFVPKEQAILVGLDTGVCKKLSTDLMLQK